MLPKRIVSMNSSSPTRSSTRSELVEPLAVGSEVIGRAYDLPEIAGFTGGRCGRTMPLMGTRPSLVTAAAGQRPVGGKRRSGSLAPGLCLAFGGAAVGMFVHHRVSSMSAHVVAVVVGVLIGNVASFRASAAASPGLRFAGRHVLRVGIVVLGLRLSLGDLAGLGAGSLAVVVVVVAITFVGTRFVGRLLGLSPGLSLLVATGYSICGASAIAAAEPFADATEEEVAYSIALVALCGSLAIGVLPAVGELLGLTSEVFGAWVGASVHDVGQVVAAASTRDHRAVEAAVVVKLTRVALLAPLLAVVAVEARRRQRHDTSAAPVIAARRPPVLPWFVVAFLAAAGMRSLGVMPASALDRARDLETLLIGAGLVGLGSQVVWSRLRTLGGRPLLLGAISWSLVAVTSLIGVSLTA